MSIESRHLFGGGRGICWDAWGFVAVCDECGAELPVSETWEDARSAMRKAGWKTTKDEHGDWVNTCPDCQ